VEAFAHSVGVVRVLQVVGEVRRRALGEEAARDGLAEERGAVVAAVERRAPLGGKRDVAELAVGELLQVLGEELGEQIRRAVVQEAVLGVTGVPVDGSCRGLRAPLPALDGRVG